MPNTGAVPIRPHVQAEDADADLAELLRAFEGGSSQAHSSDTEGREHLLEPSDDADDASDAADDAAGSGSPKSVSVSRGGASSPVDIGAGVGSFWASDAEMGPAAEPDVKRQRSS